MARRRYLIAYDIRNPKRLRRVCTIMKDYGVRLQYSVFLCDLSELELIRWRSEIHKAVDLRADSVIHVDLGRCDAAPAVATIGVPRQLPPSGPIIL
ncbi:CRISPR-associated endonuclease Cas2 [Mycolicibacterium hassiacum]|jgi:CRISPR-associated endoribonuclease Cas2|uniref:CRISPR-associated endonuclease Cas2 n=1 Tax=Mycolicibacterium hassiacum TaxID=46351 RepID=UPI0004762184|nr:CRISPR-associated endonuclease Cas2 [Mycolicibacterium hassiacum]MDA4085653.1 CRISPR-associated protein Cas2 [Mycolicibacterium hassiacum DSM 44199]